MSGVHYFESKNITYANYLKIVEIMLETKAYKYCCEHKCVEMGIESLANIKDEKKQKRLIEVSYEIDRVFKDPSSKTKTASKKLPSITAAAVLFDKHYDKIENLTDREISLCSFYLAMGNHFSDERLMSTITDKNLLMAIQEKNKTYSEQFDLLVVVMHNLSKEKVASLGEEEFLKEKNKWIDIAKNSDKNATAVMEQDLIADIKADMRKVGF